MANSALAIRRSTGFMRLMNRPGSASSSFRRSLQLPSAASRHASTASPYPKGKPIPLEQPDKFRPPSHPARLSRRAPRPMNYPGIPLSKAELEAQKTKWYPHSMPPKDSFMHWFLHNRTIHLVITLGTLTILAISSMIMNFMYTSPFSHLLPPISMLPAHPIEYVSEWMSTYRLHADYKSAEAARQRAEKLLDTQKRRLYRRAHGMEDLDAEEGQGVDIKGLVDWDDGLTNKQREALMKKQAEEKAAAGLADETTAEPPKLEKKKIKRWFGIWE